MNIKQEMYLLEQKIIKIKTDLINKINDLPDNQDITRINKTCFTMSFKSLNNNFSPYYHDFKYTYKKIIEKIDNYPPFQALERIEKIIKDKAFKEGGRIEQYVHPEVIRNLKTLIEGV